MRIKHMIFNNPYKITDSGRYDNLHGDEDQIQNDIREQKELFNIKSLEDFENNDDGEQDATL